MDDQIDCFDFTRRPVKVGISGKQHDENSESDAFVSRHSIIRTLPAAVLSQESFIALLGKHK
jgi:hypothetical protein